MYSLTKTIYFFALLLTSLNIAANDQLALSVTHENAIYSTKLSTNIHAPSDLIYKRLTAYNQLNTVSRLIYKSQLLDSGELLLKLKICFAFICFDKQQTLALTVSGRSIIGRIIPGLSDFEYGWMKWQLSDLNGDTSIHFTSEMTPDFWVPPFIGPLLIKSKLESEALYSIQQLELLAKPK